MRTMSRTANSLVWPVQKFLPASVLQFLSFCFCVCVDLTEAAGKLAAANYEKKADIGSALASSTASFQALEDALAAKKKALDADLQRELANDAAACDAFAKLVEEFQAFAHSVKTAMQV